MTIDRAFNDTIRSTSPFFSARSQSHLKIPLETLEADRAAFTTSPGKGRRVRVGSSSGTVTRSVCVEDGGAERCARGSRAHGTHALYITRRRPDSLVSRRLTAGHTGPRVSSLELNRRQPRTSSLCPPGSRGHSHRAHCKRASVPSIGYGFRSQPPTHSTSSHGGIAKGHAPVLADFRWRRRWERWRVQDVAVVLQRAVWRTYTVRAVRVVIDEAGHVANARVERQ